MDYKTISDTVNNIAETAREMRTLKNEIRRAENMLSAVKKHNRGTITLLRFGDKQKVALSYTAHNKQKCADILKTYADELKDQLCNHCIVLTKLSELVTVAMDL